MSKNKHSIVKTMSSHDREEIKKAFKGKCRVDDSLLDCIDRLRESFHDTLWQNAHLASCMRELVLAGDTQQNPDQKPPPKENDERGFLHAVSVIVEPTNGDKWHFVKEKELAKHLETIKLKKKYEAFDNECIQATDNRVNLKLHTFKTMAQYLKMWLGVLEWQNDGLSPSEASRAFSKDGCSKQEINNLAKHLTQSNQTSEFAETLRSSGIALRDMLKADVKTFLDKEFMKHRQKLVEDKMEVIEDTKKKVHMMLGVPKRKLKKAMTNVPQKTLDDNIDWSKINDSCISVGQMKRNCEIAQKLLNLADPDENWDVQVVTVSMNKEEEKHKGEVPKFHMCRNLPGGRHALDVIHKNENWNKANWLRRHVHRTLNESTLESLVIDLNWPSGKKKDRNMKKNLNYCFFSKILPGLRKNWMLSDEGSIHLPMEEWSFTMIHLCQKELEELCVVNFVTKTDNAHVEEGHHAWETDNGNCNDCCLKNKLKPTDKFLELIDKASLITFDPV